jgi:hypothetical protein
MNRPIINIDLDGVVYDFTKAVTDYSAGVLRRELPGAEQRSQMGGGASWDMHKDWGIPEGAWNFLFRRGVEDGAIWLNGDPIPGAIEGLWALSDSEWHIRIVTTRLYHSFGHDIAVEHTSKWLKRNAVPYRSLAFVGYGEKKSHYNAVSLLDDSVTNISDWNTEARAGARPGILFSQPWNTEFHGGIRAVGWDEAIKVIEAMK